MKHEYLHRREDKTLDLYIDGKVALTARYTSRVANPGSAWQIDKA
jgi:hypothetical protein